MIPLDGNISGDQVSDQVKEGSTLVFELKKPGAFERWMEIANALLFNSPASFSTKQLDKYKPMLEEFMPEWKTVLEYAATPKSRKQILEEQYLISRKASIKNM